MPKRNSVSPARILVLGATSSIAIATTRLLASPGVHFMLVARNRDRLTTVAQDLLTRGSLVVDTWVMDLDDTSSHPEMLSAAAERLGRIDLALLAQGVLGNQAEAEADFEAAAAVLHTNFVATVSLVTWLANQMQQQRGGTLAVISSVAGDRGRRSNYVYGSSKAALNTFLDGVRARIDRDGVHVLTIKPGYVSTPMTAHVPHNALFASPQQAARGILRAIEHRTDVAYVPWFWRWIMFLVCAIPGRFFKKLNL